jgi:hypothetical protein
MGNSEPYFAFGRDVFGEFSQTPISVNYDNNVFQAITQDYLIQFDEKNVTGVYAVDDITHEHNLLNQVDVTSIERNLKALIQSYYSRIEQKNYLVGNNSNHSNED